MLCTDFLHLSFYTPTFCRAQCAVALGWCISDELISFKLNFTYGQANTWEQPWQSGTPPTKLQLQWCITSHPSALAGMRQGRARYTHVSDIRQGQTRFVLEILSGGNRAHTGMIRLDLKCLQEFVHMGNEVKNLILLKAHLSLPYRDPRDNET